ncbi:MAG: hypothetical protein IJ055_00970 [Oscillospiraceae bacterium]|nr:hypothetical protein [Oscillospiraceae bacterium]
MNHWKRLLACLLTAALLVPASALPAAADGEEEEAAVDAAQTDEEASGEEAAEEGEKVSVEEEVEEFDAPLEEVQAICRSIGENDGYEVYVRPDDYKDQVEAYCQKQYSDEDERKDAVKEMEKHLKKVEVALVDTTTGRLAAELEEIAKTKEEKAYFSEAGRFLVYLNADMNKVQRIRYRVSTLDSEFLFLTKDKETLELYSQDYKELRVSMKLSEQNGEQSIYRSSDKLYWAMLSPDQDEAWACVKQVAENDNFKMYVDEDTAIIALENKANGYIWWSSPLNCNRDTRATKLLVSDLQSSAVLTYGDSVSRGITNLRSRISADIKIKEEKDGITITYSYDKCGVTIPIRYTLEDDYMSVSVKCSEIKETKTEQGLLATQLTMLGSFGAAGPDEEGYFVIPDGCGSLIRFNNGKSGTKSYTQKVYGRDITTVPTTRPAVTEKILMPVYGIVKDGNAMAVIIDKGDGNATLNASVSGQSLSSYNICSFNFQLRGSDTFYMAGDYGNLTVFEDGDIKTDTISVRYYPIAKEDASFVDIAETYRNYLTGDGGVSAKAAADSSQMYLDLYGGTMKARSVLGIPVTMKTSMTSYSEAQKIVEGLSDQGVDNMVVVYNNWTNEGISGKVDNKAKPSGALGGSGDFNRLTKYLEEQGYLFYPSVNNKVFKSGNGYYTFLDTTIRISNSYSRQMTYNLSYGVQDMNEKTKSLLSPATFTELYGKLGKSYAKRSLTGVSLGEMTSTVWGDYGNQQMSRDDTIAALQDSYSAMQSEGLSILADTCAAYAFPYADRISDAPLQSSGFDVFDEDVPFYQIVLHGVLPYSGTAINGSADSDAAFLTSVATGCDPAYDMIYAEASDLKDTSLEAYYYSHYAFWSEEAAREYGIASKVLSAVSDQTITGYERNDDTSVTTYSDGTKIVVDYTEKTITVGSQVYRLEAEKGE